VALAQREQEFQRVGGRLWHTSMLPILALNSTSYLSLAHGTMGTDMKRNVLVVSFSLLLLAALIGWFVTVRPAHPDQKLSQAELIQKVHSNLLGRVEVIYTKGGPMTLVRGTFYETDATGQIVVENGKATELPFTASVYLTEELEVKLLANSNLTVVERRW